MLEIKDLSVAYGNREIVHNVDFSVQPGETVCIVGESGSGKSTLLKAITGLLGQEGHITGGRIEFDGRNLAQSDPKEYRSLRGSRIAMVYQHAGESMDPVIRIGRQFQEELSLKGKISRRESDRKTAECMKQLLLKEPERILRSYPPMLSGGTNQRVALALAMVMEPELILADEPTGNLDSKNSQDVIALLTQASRRYQQTILMITHNKDLTASVDRVFRVSDGVLTDLGGKTNEALS